MIDKIFASILHSAPFLFAAIILFSQSALAEKQINIAYYPLPLHVTYNEKTKKPEGPLIDYFNLKIAKKMGVKFNWIGPFYSFPRLFKEIEYKNLDMIYMSSVKNPMLSFSKLPFRIGQKSLVVQKKLQINSVKNKKDIAGLKVVHFLIDKKYILPLLIGSNRLTSPELIFISGKAWMTRAVKMINLDRADAAYGPEKIPLEYEVKRLGLTNKLKIIPIVGEGVKFHTAFNKIMKGESALRKNYDKSVAKIDISYDDFLKEYLKMIK